MIRVISKMDLGVGVMGFIFCICDKNSGEQSRAHGLSCFDKSSKILTLVVC